MDATDANTGFGEAAQLFEVLHRGMSRPSIGIDDNRRCAIEDRFVSRPAVFHYDSFEAKAGFLQLVGEEHGASAMLVLAVAVAVLSGDEDDFMGCWFGGGCECADDASECYQELVLRISHGKLDTEGFRGSYHRLQRIPRCGQVAAEKQYGIPKYMCDIPENLRGHPAS